MRMTGTGAVELIAARLTTQLKYGVNDLARSRRADRMPLCLETTAEINWYATRRRRLAPQRSMTAFAFPKKPQILRVHDFGNCETIMHFGKIDVLGTDLGIFVSSRHGPSCRPKGRQI